MAHRKHDESFKKLDKAKRGQKISLCYLLIVARHRFERVFGIGNRYWLDAMAATELRKDDPT